MPGTVAHCLFGLEVQGALAASDRPSSSTHDSAILNAMVTCPHAYMLGLQGPDIFMLSPSFALRGVLWHHDLAGMLHEYRTGRFLYAILRLAAEGTKAEIAYACGFLAHFIMDAHCHPYIYARAGLTVSSEALGRHLSLEADIDEFLLQRRWGISRSAFPQAELTSLSRKEKAAVSRLLSRAISIAHAGISVSHGRIRLAFREVAFVSRLLRDPRGWRSRTAGAIEETVLGHRVLTPLFLRNGSPSPAADPAHRHRWVSPFTGQISYESFNGLAKKAMEETLSVLNCYNALLTASPARRAFARKRLLAALPNRCCKSGQPSKPFPAKLK